MNEKSLYQLTYGLYVVGAQAEGKKSACIVNTLAQVTAEPVRMSVTVNKDSFTCELMEKSGCFSAVALDERADLPLIGRFGFRSGRDFPKLEDIPVAEDELGSPYPLTAVCARFSCKIIKKVDLDTHILFVGEAVEGEIMSEANPLTYTYYRNVIKGGTPAGAPSYQKK